MILNNPVLAQTGAGDSLLLMPDQQFLGTTTTQDDINDNFHQDQSMRHTSSAANLARLAETQDKRLVSEVRSLREERNKMELALEESRSAQKQAEKVAEEAREAARKAADIADSLRKAAEAAGVQLDDHLVEASKYLPTSEQEIGLLKAEIADLKTRVFDPKKAMSMLSQMPSLSMISQMPMMMGLGGIGGIGKIGGISGLNPLGGIQKVASMPNFLADGVKRERLPVDGAGRIGAVGSSVDGAGLGATGG